MADENVLKIFDELKKLHEDKDADYAGGEPLSNFRRCEQFGIPAWKGVAVRLSDKWSRFVSLASSERRHCVKGENLDDTLSDLAVYAVICLALRRHARGDAFVDAFVDANEVSKDGDWVSKDGDRVKRERDDDGDEGCEDNRPKQKWNDAKRSPVLKGRMIFDDAKRSPVLKGRMIFDDEDDSVITSQEECAKRFAEGEKSIRNFDGIND